MGSDPKKPRRAVPGGDAALSLALGQSEQVQSKVEQAGTDLSSINAVLKDEIALGMPRAEVELALNESEAVETKVQEAAEELGAVNDLLAKEIDERHELEHRLSSTDAALAESRVEARRARHDSLHDAVTGLPNRALFNDRLDHAIMQAKRHTRRLAVLFLDVDEFKSVNDAHGHHVGDRILQIVAQRLQASVRADDTVSRFGGDEFLILMLEVNDGFDAAAFAAGISVRLAEACDIDDVTLTVKSSIGVALYPEDGSSAQELIKNADVAMYAAKRQKKGALLYREVRNAESVGTPLASRT